MCYNDPRRSTDFERKERPPAAAGFSGVFGMDSVRKIALGLLVRQETAAVYSNIALDTALRRADLSPADRGLLTALVYGVLERKITLDDWIDRLCDRGSEKIPTETRILLRMGLYQIACLDRVPDHAAVNETVALAPKRTRGFVNAILREFLRRGKTLPLPDGNDDPIGYLSVKYSFGKELCRAFVDEYGREKTERIFEAFSTPPPLTLRVNTLRTTRDDLLRTLSDAGIEARPTEQSPVGISLCGVPPTELPGFDEGLFFVQDEASQLCVEALDAAPGMRVADVCACPGSKSFGCGCRMENRGSILARDLHGNKLSLVQSGAARLGITILSTEERDARTPSPEERETFDRVLCDVPCSGLGVCGKKPELRYKNPAESEGLPEIQYGILETSSALLRTGGKIVYSTCTLLDRENGAVVRRFLTAHPEFTLLSERTLFPHTDRTDGFYFAVLQKRG